MWKLPTVIDNMLGYLVNEMPFAQRTHSRGQNLCYFQFISIEEKEIGRPRDRKRGREREESDYLTHCEFLARICVYWTYEARKKRHQLMTPHQNQ